LPEPPAESEAAWNGNQQTSLMSQTKKTVDLKPEILRICRQSELANWRVFLIDSIVYNISNKVSILR
ncbi:hypothetical protein ACE198_11020, partial [Neobacillus sp. KR4-4]|uniref:hypothetical protein n=1 Tax=Neobacillus sp. KR4-4 TaxID=3344872 RepID=UPI0035CA3C3E